MVIKPSLLAFRQSRLPGSPWRELSQRDCGWWVPSTAEALAETLATAIGMGDLRLRSMGEKGRQLVYEKYTWDRCGVQMITHYEKIIRGEK
ncbi:MAG: glycosyltransferase [Gammaproteobacteria bacterium]